MPKVTDPRLLSQLNQSGQMVAPNPMFPGQLQGQSLNNTGQSISNQKSGATLPYDIRTAKAQATRAELDTKTAQEEWDTKHPRVSTSGVYGDAYLKTLPPSEQSVIKALSEGRLAFPSGAGMRSPAWMQKLQEVAQYDPTFDATNFNTRAQTRINAVKGKLGGSNNALNTAIGHLGELYGQIDGTASHGGFPLATAVNSIENAYSRNRGDKGITNFEQTAGLVADELEAAYRNGGGAEAGVVRSLRSLSPNMSQEQKQGVVRNAINLLSSKISANLSQYNFGTGGTPTWDMLDPHTKQVLDTIAPDIRDKYFSDPANPNGGSSDLSARLDAMIKSGAPYEDVQAFAKGLGVPAPDQATYDKAVKFAAANRGYKGPLGLVGGGSPAPPQPGTYADSYASQGLSGANEGLASVLGAPADLARAAINLVPKGINAVANTNIPTLPEAIGGGEWWKNRLGDVGSIQPPTDDPSKQFVRRVGQSVGAAAVPAGAAGSLGKLGAGLLSGLGGGIGAATAQNIAPGNPIAEILGELAGGGATGFGLAKTVQRSAQRGIEAAVPTVEDLKAQASNLYRKAETNGVAASPTQTRQLATDMRTTLRDEGQLGPRGRITNADTNTSKAVNLIDQYAGRRMTPKEMNTVRTVLGDSRKSADPSDRRLGSILLDQFDSFASPLAPEFDQARAVSSRYLQTQDLERARELAGARASQFTGSGFENALRTEYRGLDRNNIKGNNYFNDDVNGAIQKVARGTPTSNFFRGLGRLAPTGPVSGMGSVVPALGVGAMTSPTLGGIVGGGLAGSGILGRTVATRMGVRAADEAELIARNGGALPQAPLLPQSLGDFAAWLAASQLPKYVKRDSKKR